MAQACHHGAVTGMRDEEVCSRKHAVVRDITPQHRVFSGLYRLGRNSWPCRHQRVDLELRKSVAKPLQKRNLVLMAGAETDHNQWPPWVAPWPELGVGFPGTTRANVDYVRR